MRKITLGAILLFGMASMAHAGLPIAGDIIVFFSLDSSTKPVYCEVGEVRLLAQNDAACGQAGGRVTHRIEQRVVEASDSE